MATKKRKSTKSKDLSTKNQAADTKVTRISASDDVAPLKKRKAKNPAKPDKDTQDVVDTTKKSSRNNPIRAIGGYFAGSWYEIRQVRWPTRAATWKLTVALLFFTGFFVGIILLLDWAFQTLFNTLLG